MRAHKEFFGLLMLVVPGIQAFFRYMLVGPISVFEQSRHSDAAAVLEKSERLTKGSLLKLASLFVGTCIVTALLDVLIGRGILQLFFWPVIWTYFTICVVRYYEQLNRAI